MESRDALFLVGFFMLCMTVIIIACTYMPHKVEQDYIKNGYTRRTLQGQSMATWVRD